MNVLAKVPVLSCLGILVCSLSISAQILIYINTAEKTSQPVRAYEGLSDWCSDGQYLHLR